MTPAPALSRTAVAWRAESGRPTWAIVVSDLVRVAAVVSLILVTTSGGAAVALFLLVLGGTMVPRAVGAGSALDATYCVSVLGAAWCAELDAYRQWAALDLMVHAVATGAIAAVAHLVLVRAGAAGGPVRRPRTAAAVLTVGLGAFLAIVWELGEWTGRTFVDDAIFVSYTDTLGDLAASVAGTVVAGALVARRVARHVDVRATS